VRLRLGTLTFDSETRQLLRGRSDVHLSPKAFELLNLLLAARPRALAKAELQDHLWPDLFVSETNLASLVAEIRRALDDDAHRPRFVRTAHRFGYAFCGEAVDVSERVVTDSSPVCWLLKDRRRLPLGVGENVLGREPDGGISLDSQTVSRRHARIIVSDRGAVLEDLHSKNGTFLRDARVTSPTALADGDRIRVGSVVMHFRTASGSKTATWSEQRHVVTRPLSPSPKRRVSR
jgi:DNA-binding winged helix-turn-helix (wHTH) protein